MESVQHHFRANLMQQQTHLAFKEQKVVVVALWRPLIVAQTWVYLSSAALFSPLSSLHTSVWSLSMLHIPTASECGARFKRILQQWPFPPRAASLLTDCASHPANNSARFGQQPRRRKTLNGAFCRIPPHPTSTMRSHHVIPSVNLFRRARGLIQRGTPVIISEQIWSRLDPSHFYRGNFCFF